MKKITRLIVLSPFAAVLAVALVYGCRTQTPEIGRLKDVGDTAPANDVMSEDRWRNKVSERLRYGSRITPEEETALAGLDRAAFIAKMMEDPRFALTILDFNMDFLGREIDHLVELTDAPATPQNGGFEDFNSNNLVPNVVPPGTPGAGTGTVSGTGSPAPVDAGPNPHLAAFVYTQPQALASAAAMQGPGDYFEFFNANPPVVIESPAALSSNPADLRAKLGADFDLAIKAFGEPATDTAAPIGCSRIMSLSGKMSLGTGKNPQDQLKGLKIDGGVRHVLNLIAQNWLGALSRSLPVGDFNSAQTGECQKQPVSAEAMVKKLGRIKEATFAVLDQIDAKKKPQTDQPMTDLITVDMGPFADLPPLARAFSYDGQWKILKNSSTNYSRKRAAYVLRTFTCDDMTPVSTESEHMEGGSLHAAQPACMACHYKMDPIAAIFAPYGVGGVEFRGDAKEHIFDDALRMDRASEQYKIKYLGEYKAADGTTHIGHYKSLNALYPEWTEANPDNVSLATLFDYFKKSPIVRQCLTKRLTEKVLGKKQVYDGKWIEQLAQNFEGGASGTEAVKKTIAQIVMSKTFARKTITAGQCYDFAPGFEPAPDSPPCEVASIINKYCKSCHNEDNPSGDLDMTKWLKGPNGVSQFAHYLSEGKLVPKKDSIKWMIASITNPKSLKRDRDGDGVNDPLLLMPYKKDFPESEKQILYKWLEKQTSAEGN